MEKENLRDRMPVPGTKLFLDGEGASVRGFLDFCKRNTPLMITGTLAVIFVYGIMLFNIALIGDNRDFLHDPANYTLSFFESESFFAGGRWTTPLLTKLFFIKESGIFASSFLSALWIWLFSILFCYFIAVFTKNTKRRNGLIPTALIVLTYAVWSQYFLFFYQNKIQTAFVCLNLIGVYLAFDGFVTRDKTKVIISFILTLLSFAVYQPLLPHFLCIVFVYFVLLQENSNYPAKEYSFLCLKLFVFFIAAFALNLVISRIIFLSMPYIPPSDYIASYLSWNNNMSIKTIITGILAQIYVLTIGAIPFVHSILAPMMPAMYGSSGDMFNRPIADTVLAVSRSVGNVLLLPAVILFLVMVFINAKNRIPKGRRLLYVLAGFGVPLSILFLVMISGKVSNIRILYALPFAAAFMFYYVSYRQKTVLRRVFYCLILATVFHQAQISQSLLEASVRLGEMDAKIAFDLDARVRGVLQNDEKPPLVFIGRLNHPFDGQAFRANEIGRSLFEFWSLTQKGWLSEGALRLMSVYGFDYDIATPEQIEEAYEASRDMPSYPLEGCVKNLGDVVVVKMGE